MLFKNGKVSEPDGLQGLKNLRGNSIFDRPAAEAGLILRALRHGWSRALQRFGSCHTDSKAFFGRLWMSGLNPRRTRTTYRSACRKCLWIAFVSDLRFKSWDLKF